MATVLPPVRNDISGTAPNPSNAVARAAFGVLHDYLMNLLGSAGSPKAARAALEVPDTLARNIIINGACTVQQRASLVVSNGVTGYGGPDRFISANQGAGGQFTQAASTLTFGGQVKDTVRQTVNTATTAFTTTNYWYGISQNIEGLNAYHLKDKPFVVSFIFNTNLTGTYSVAVKDGSGGYAYVSTFAAVANTPVKVTIAVPVISGAASIPRTNALGLSVFVGFLNQATYQTATLNSWLAGNFFTASTQTIWSATIGNFIELTELQVEAGTVATPFECRSIESELAQCQRYFFKTYNQGVNPAAVTPVGAVSIFTHGASNYASVHCSFKRTMRATPSSVVIYNPATGATASMDADGVAKAALTSNAGMNGVTAYINNVATAINSNVSAQIVADAEIY